ncbi:MAG: TraM recognition domain-containing protein [Clostridia bacterium]|nr:TraM recognition domain-containing protein [Clostridia bacterium]
MNTFCPKKEDITFKGFRDLVDNGKIVVLNMNIAEYRNLSKIIATYLKLDFQTEVMSRLSRYNSNFFRSVAFICDEFHEYCSSSDADFFAQSREAKCINIVATQSYSSLLNAINNPYAVNVIIQNLINKFWFRTDDIATIDDIQKQIGKEDKFKISRSITENAKETHYSYFTDSLNSKDSNLSESISKSIQNDYIYDTNFFTQELETFSCLSFLSDGYKILKPMKLKLMPYFIK